MTFARGATLATPATLGHADTSSLGPTAGNGFYKRWPDDIALLADLGITDVRLTLDWPRLQPKPGELDADWCEFFTNVLTAAAAVDLRVWATAYDGAVPRWLDNEGGLDDADAARRWWPRWIERLADRFGDHVAGWIPTAEPLDALLPQPWRDTWGILGGWSPVVATVRDADLGSVEVFQGRCDLVGVVLSAPNTDVATTTDRLDETEERMGEILEHVAEAADTALAVTFAPPGDDGDLDAALVARVVSAVDHVGDGGIDITTTFVDPAIAGQDTPAALLAADRTPGPGIAAFLGT